MKKINLIIAFCISLSMHAQSISSHALNATGNSVVAGNIQLEWSVGEMTSVQTLTAGGTILTQGLLQPAVPLNSPLPVTLLYFKGEQDNDKNLLTWSTSQEINNHHFDVERSANGINFQVLKQIAGAGNSSVIKNYSSIDTFPFPASWYRLKQVDTDGHFSYSPVIMLQRKDLSSFKIYPNPTTGILNLSGIAMNKALQVFIYDMSGKLILQRTLVNATSPIDVNNLPKGTYVIKIKELATQFTWSAKFIKQ